MNDDEGGDIGDVYYCTWEKAGEGKYVGWEKKHPFLRVAVSSPLELASALGNVVGEHYSDFEAAIHLDPAIESIGKPELFADGFIQIGWNGTFTFRPSRQTAFVGGRCNECGSGLGARAASPLVVDSSIKGDGAFSSGTWGPPPGNGDPAWLIVVSQEFLGQLTDIERAQFDVRPVRFENVAPKRFYEVIPKRFVPEVAIKGYELNGARCETCGRQTISHGKALGWGVSAVCRSDLNAIVNECFFVGSPLKMGMFSTAKRWRELCGKQGAQKLTGAPLAVVDDQTCLRRPWFPTQKEKEVFRTRHNLYQWATIVSTGEEGMLRGYSKDMRSYVDGKV